MPNCNTDIDTATISVVVQPVPDSVLVQQVAKTKATTTGALAFDYTRHDSLEAEIELRKSEPLPFSNKRSMFSTGNVAQVWYSCVTISDLVLPVVIQLVDPLPTYC